MAQYHDWDEACEPINRVVCWTRQNKLDPQRSETYCYTSFTVCNNLRDSTMRGWEADWNVVRDCAAEDATASAESDVPQSATSGYSAADEPSVFLVVRSLATNREIKVAAPQADKVAVFDSGWTCAVEKPPISHPAVGSKGPTIPFDMYLHSAECVRVNTGVGFTLQCPTSKENLASYKKTRDIVNLVEMIILIDHGSGDPEQRYFVSLLCE